MKTTFTRACETRYLGLTDHRGARVKATHLTTLTSVTISWDHALDSQENRWYRMVITAKGVAARVNAERGFESARGM